MLTILLNIYNYFSKNVSFKYNLFKHWFLTKTNFITFSSTLVLILEIICRRTSNNQTSKLVFSDKKKLKKNLLYKGTFLYNILSWLVTVFSFYTVLLTLK